MRQGFQAVVFTVGHSTRPLAEFIALLAAHSVRQLIDVRTVPRSRHNPQFNRDTLPLRWRSPESAMRMLPAWEVSVTRTRGP